KSPISAFKVALWGKADTCFCTICTLMALSGNDILHRMCLLMTQSGHGVLRRNVLPHATLATRRRATHHQALPQAPEHNSRPQTGGYSERLAEAPALGWRLLSLRLTGQVWPVRPPIARK